MSIWTCGPDDGNRLGRPRINDEPGKIAIPDDLTIVQIAIGWKHGHFFTDQNHFYSWGTGASWRLGTGTKFNLPSPTRINTFPPDTCFKQVACGDKFSAVTTQSGQLLVWGAGYAHTPTALELPSPAEFIACGQICLLAALADGSVMQFYRHSSPAHHNFVEDRIVSVACGANHKLALAESGRVYSWGTSPATGQGSVDLPRVIKSLLEVPICSIFAYHNSSFFLDTQYRVWCCGTNSSGSLGLGNIDDVTAPTPQNFLFNNEQIVQIACGDDFTLYLSAAGNVWASGNGGDHRNATGSNETRTRPAPAVKLAGKFISQVAAGCFNSSFLENGCPPFNHMTQFRGSYIEFPVPPTPFRATTRDRLSVEIDPSPHVIKKFGFAPNDIIIFEGNERAKVIGVANEEIAVIREKKNQICILSETRPLELIAQHPLVSRVNAVLVQGKCIDGFEITVDAQPSVTLPLGGFLAGDIVTLEQNPSIEYKVMGARIGLVWISDKENKFHYHDFKQLLIKERKGKNVKQMLSLKNVPYVVEIEDNQNDLVFHNEYGVGFFVGRVGFLFCYTFICVIDKILLLDRKLEFARKMVGDDHEEFTTITFERKTIYTSVERCKETGFYVFDRVMHDEEYGTVVGICEGKVAIRTDHQMTGTGYIELVDKNSIILLGRVNIEGYRSFGDLTLSINTTDFQNTHFLPNDKISYQNQRAFICGTLDNEVYALFENEDEPNIITNDAILIGRFIESNAKEIVGEYEIDVSLIHCALLQMQPCDIVKTLDGLIVEFIGISSGNNLLFRNITNGEIKVYNLRDLSPDFIQHVKI